jgi:FtsZ-binding cell division protein ZapB
MFALCPSCGGTFKLNPPSLARGFAIAKWYLDNICTALGLSNSDGQSALTVIGKLLEEHDEIVALRLMTSRVDEIQELRETIRELEHKVSAFDDDRQTERQRADKLADEKAELRDALRDALHRLPVSERDHKHVRGE